MVAWPKLYLFYIICFCSCIALLSILYNRYNLPKIIWSYWNDENIPESVKKIMDHRAKILQGWDFRVLHDSTIHEYLDSFPPNYEKMRQSHKSDWLRLALLEKYGGCWLDATIIVNSPSEFEKLYNDSVKQQSEFTGFYTPLGQKDGDPTTFIESWFIMCPKGSRVIHAWYEEFMKACNMGFLEYRREAMKIHTFSTHIYNPSNEDVYLTVYATAQMAIQERLKRQVNIILYNSYDTMYKLHYDCWNKEKADYDSECIVALLHEKKDYVKQIPFIKLTHAQHRLL